MHALLKSKEEPAGTNLFAAFDRPGQAFGRDDLHHTLQAVVVKQVISVLFNCEPNLRPICLFRSMAYLGVCN